MSNVPFLPLPGQPCPDCGALALHVAGSAACRDHQRASESPLVCSCTPDDDPGCPVHGCTCPSVAAHLVSPCEYPREQSEARQRVPDPHSLRAANVRDNRRETYDRAGVVRSILERCYQEIGALEVIAHLTEEDVNALSCAKGFAERALLALGRLPL